MNPSPLFPSFKFSVFRLVQSGEDSLIERLFVVCHISQMPSDYNWATFWQVIGLPNVLGLEPADWVELNFFFDEHLAERIAAAFSYDRVLRTLHFAEAKYGFWVYDTPFSQSGNPVEGGNVVEVVTKIHDPEISAIEYVTNIIRNMMRVNNLPLNVEFDRVVELEREKDVWDRYLEVMSISDPEVREMWLTTGPDPDSIASKAVTPVGRLVR